MSSAHTRIKSIEEIETEIIEEFSFFDDWTDKYSYIIELGEALPPLEEKYKNDMYKVQGCQSNVWLVAKQISENKIHFMANSDAAITRGLIALLVRVLDNQPKEEIIKTKLNFLSEIGLGKHLSLSRSNGLNAMVNKIKNLASSI